ncbi:WXG100 family type VII secretion target [Kitasatospora sp. A2-31]|uniref:WXG100 family type VII secretion target n=1 Tax=Kitasatospora sp. A2-31 TaxID=2916414 RepID=UPI001EEA7765|nr:WXG100 family type VII secretion target [Kitasatospora sp. A2-31]MCG6495629.1 WXG100 family type VII secretion target [Kitasatospora sp. A2-31]MCG6500407.1 WXG100 family type VII secretion target [Kitasatospora sp. A2-31]MCG6500492.1 WXG100 family type VII secretion target [Kitasatospora sp. A2-31]MCG6500495.1 WXG100 family type VII secretion target [Kitasatospora sp. A2-31]
MSTYTVNMSQVEYIVGEMSAISSRLQQTLSQLDDGTTQHLSEWSSDARSTYDAAKLRWDAAAADMVLLAQNATTALGGVHDAYHSGERFGAGLWDQ